MDKNNKIKNDELYHFGVVGMKWGQKQFLGNNFRKVTNSGFMNTGIASNSGNRTLVNGQTKINIGDKLYLGKSVPSENSKSVSTGKAFLAALGIAAVVGGGIYLYKKNKQRISEREKENEENRKNQMLEMQNKSSSNDDVLKLQKRLAYERGKNKALKDITTSKKKSVKHSEDEGVYLCHYGVKGQKWGVINYTNEDGSLSKKGKRSYVKETKKIGGNIGAIAGMTAGGAVAAGIIGSHWKENGSKFRLVKDGSKIISLMGAFGGLGLSIGKFIGKRKGKSDVAEYGRQYVENKFSEDPTLQQLDQQNQNDKKNKRG